MELSRILVAHDGLESAFALHQELVLSLELEAARAALDVYARLLAVHMGHEEELLLPELARVTAPRWPLALYSGQHAKMRTLLAELDASLALAAQSGSTRTNLRARAIALLDRESTYKHLVEHHDSAEHQALYPELEGALAEPRKAELVERCLTEWNAALAPAAEVLARLSATHLAP